MSFRYIKLYRIKNSLYKHIKFMHVNVHQLFYIFIFKFYIYLINTLDDGQNSNWELK